MSAAPQKILLNVGRVKNYQFDFRHESVDILLDILKSLEGEVAGFHPLELDHDRGQRGVEAVRGLDKILDARGTRKATLV